jgi:hypothetical protein
LEPEKASNFSSPATISLTELADWVGCRGKLLPIFFAVLLRHQGIFPPQWCVKSA